MEVKLINEFLKEIELFKGLDEDEIKLISKQVEVKEFSAGSIVFMENSPRKNLYVIYEGEIELFKKTRFGEEKRLSFFTKFDFMGEGTLMDDSPHSTSARSLLDSTLFAISRDKLIDIYKQYPDLGIKMLSRIAKVVYRRMKQSNSRIVNALAEFKSGRTRLEHDLLGEREVPNESYYGVQTLRALENFNISGIPISQFPALIEALAMVKMAAAKANNTLGLLSKPITDSIVQAC
ncbi:MAG: cyclic nucleotide-binding domain-containing protein, partial [Clostridiales bacterium]